jgi:hypothetical protein
LFTLEKINKEVVMTNSTATLNKKFLILISCLLMSVITFEEVRASNNVKFTASSDWGSGFVADVTVTNSSQTTSDGWQVEFDFPHKITNIWSAEIVSHIGNHYIIKNAAWNGKIQSGTSKTFGFQGTPGNVTAPTNITLTIGGNFPPQPEAPIANNDNATTDFETPTTINILSNDTGDNIRLSSLNTQPQHGTAAIIGDDTVLYTPEAGFYGNDSFSYTIKDSINQESSATVNIVVNQAPVETYTITASSVNISSGGGGSGESYPEFVQPYAHSTYSAGDKITFEGDAYESLIDNNAWSPSAYPRGWKEIPNGGGNSGGIITPSGNITVNQGESKQFIITPNSGYSIEDVKVDDQSAGRVTNYGFSNITANHTILAEFIEGSGPEPTKPVANNDTATTSTNNAATVSVLDNDTGENIQISSVTQPANGTASISNSSAVYTPASGFTGNDNFQYTVTDSNGNTASATVFITVTATEVLKANNDNATTYEEASKLIDVLANDTGSQISISNITQPAHGAAVIENGKVRYTPVTGFAGNDSLHYTVTDSAGKTATASIFITVLTKSTFNKAIIGY